MHPIHAGIKLIWIAYTKEQPSSSWANLFGPVLAKIVYRVPAALRPSLCRLPSNSKACIPKSRRIENMIMHESSCWKRQAHLKTLSHQAKPSNSDSMVGWSGSRHSLRSQSSVDPRRCMHGCDLPKYLKLQEQVSLHQLVWFPRIFSQVTVHP